MIKHCNDSILLIMINNINQLKSTRVIKIKRHASRKLTGC